MAGLYFTGVAISLFLFSLLAVKGLAEENIMFKKKGLLTQWVVVLIIYAIIIALMSWLGVLISIEMIISTMICSHYNSNNKTEGDSK